MFHENRDPENIHASLHEDFDGGSVGPGVVLSQFAWNGSVSEFSSGFVDAEPLEDS